MYIRPRNFFLIVISIMLVGIIIGGFYFSTPQKTECNIIPMTTSTHEESDSRVPLQITLNCNGDMVALEGEVGRSVEGGTYFINEDLYAHIVTPRIGEVTVYDLH